MIKIVQNILRIVRLMMTMIILGEITDFVCRVEFEVSWRIGDDISSYGGVHIVRQVQVPEGGNSLGTSLLRWLRADPGLMQLHQQANSTP